VLGHDPQSPGRTSGSESESCSSSRGLGEHHGARDALDVRRYYERPRDIDEVIELVGLSEKRDARVKTLSAARSAGSTSGSRSSRSDLVFLDEPTTGFDPARGGQPGR